VLQKVSISIEEISEHYFLGLNIYRYRKV